MMRLTELEPRWFSVQGDARHGLTFNCPHCHKSGTRLAIALHVDGTNFDPEPSNPQCFASDEKVWAITGGTSFDDLSLTPSIDASQCGHWHGFITNGEIR